MSYKLQKPYNQNQRADFIVTYNHNQGLLIKETEEALYALQANEIMDETTHKPVIDPDYEKKQEEKEKEIQKENLLNQLDELDKKRIRAVCEPSMKDTETTWLEYYNSQIAEIRRQLAVL